MTGVGWKLSRLAGILFLVFICQACADRGKVFDIDGSSTVYPISLAVAEEYTILHPGARLTVAFSGTGGGFERFCRGEVEVNDASRVIDAAEVAACRMRGISFIELPVALDAITVAVSAQNDFVRCLTVHELRRMFAPGSAVTTWRDVRPEWPRQAIQFFTPGTDSGTFDYFTHAVVGKAGASRTDVFPSEDDNVLVQGTAASPFAIGYFGYAYYRENRNRLRAVAVDDGGGCVSPTPDTITSGAYVPLSRPLFMYVAAQAADINAQLGGFVRFYLSPEARPYIADTGYLPLSGAVYQLAERRFEEHVTGSAFMDFAPGDSITSTVSEGLP
ncbi:MAG TPA: PstS family phosphate ABC transporter substrate-binding protein [Trueperaceae bacterium]